MRNLRLPRRLLFPVLGSLALGSFALVVLACDAPAPPKATAEAAPGWTRLDLATIQPRVENLDGTPASVEAESLYPGRGSTERAAADPGGVWILDRLLGAGWSPPNATTTDELSLGGQVRTVEHPTDLRLAWSVTIPPGTHLTYRPRHADCTIRYRLRIRRDGQATTVDQAEVRPATDERGPWGEPERVVDLTPWAGRDVEIVAGGEIEEDVAECGDAVLGWSTPILWSRPTASDPTPSDPTASDPTAFDPTPAATTPAERPKAHSGDRPPGVILVGLDTVRADRLGAWGRDPSPTPALDRLAEQSDVFLRAYSTFNVTTPSFVSIHSGLYGKHHGVYRLGTPASEEIRTLAEIFRDAGHSTQAVLAATHLGGEASGLGQGFEGVHTPWGQWAAEEVVRRGLRWLREVEDARVPFFLWLHLFDPHTPQTPPLPYARGEAPDGLPGLSPVERWRRLRPGGLLPWADPSLGAQPRLYDDELAYMDRQIGRLMDFLEQRGLLENTWIAVVADHGENLGEHGLVCRHAGLWDTTTHVPLMIRPPGPWTGPATRGGERFDGLVQTVDLFPTILRRAGLSVPPSDGEDLYELAERGGRAAVFAEHSHAAGAMVRTDTHLLYRHHGSEEAGEDGVTPGLYLYDLADDPAQERNLAGRGLPAEKDLLRRLDAWLADRGDAFESGPSALDEEEKERLRALGYLE